MVICVRDATLAGRSPAPFECRSLNGDATPETANSWRYEVSLPARAGTQVFPRAASLLPGGQLKV